MPILAAPAPMGCMKWREILRSGVLTGMMPIRGQPIKANPTARPFVRCEAAPPFLPKITLAVPTVVLPTPKILRIDGIVGGGFRCVLDV